MVWVIDYNTKDAKCYTALAKAANCGILVISATNSLAFLSEDVA
jgi:hypothetical protein